MPSRWVFPTLGALILGHLPPTQVSLSGGTAVLQTCRPYAPPEGRLRGPTRSPSPRGTSSARELMAPGCVQVGVHFSAAPRLNVEKCVITTRRKPCGRAPLPGPHCLVSTLGMIALIPCSCLESGRKRGPSREETGGKVLSTMPPQRPPSTSIIVPYGPTRRSAVGAGGAGGQARPDFRPPPRPRGRVAGGQACLTFSGDDDDG